MGENTLIDFKKVNDLQRFIFTIPSQQRGYKWSPENIRVLLDDLCSFYEDDNSGDFYCLQPVAVVKNDEFNYEVLDGQQRLTTLFLINKAVNNAPIYDIRYERDGDKSPDKTLSYFVNNITNTLDEETSDKYYMSQAYKTIVDWLDGKDGETSANSTTNKDLSKDRKQKIRKLLEGDKKSIKFVWYCISGNAIDKHELFRNLNSGKIALTNSDLIKAVLATYSPIGTKELYLAQFEQMEHELSDEHFWYMISSSEVNSKQSRLDLIFNVALIEKEDLQKSAMDSFYTLNVFLKKKEGISELWKKVRQTYTRLRDFYNDPIFYHYIGFLTYCNPASSIKTLIEQKQIKNDTDFISYLRKEVRRYVRTHNRVEEYSYQDNKVALRRLFVLHNIETIISKYCDLHENKSLSWAFEQFPFDLLNKETWDIEHISSQTDNPLSSEKDWEAWIASTMEDYKEDITYALSDSQSGITQQMFDAYKKKKSKETFSTIYKAIISYLDNQLGGQKIESKDGIGNLVLLDHHTNRSFHNALYPRKRRIVIMADGNQNEDDAETGIQKEYIPLCTKQVFMKFYNKNLDVKMNAWTKNDYDAYLEDMEAKLCYYFSLKEGE